MSEEKSEMDVKKAKLRVMTYWLFVVALFSWVIPFVLYVVLNPLFALGLKVEGMKMSFGPSLVPFAIGVVLYVIVYFVYRKLILKI